MAAIIGKAETNTQISPITKNDCVYFNCQVDELKYFEDDLDPHPITIYKDASTESLLISDETGSIRIDIRSVNFILKSDLQETVTADTHPEICNRLSELGVNITSGQDNIKSYLVHEGFISAGEPIYILGHVRQSKGNRIITNKWNQRIIISDFSQEDLFQMYSNQLNLVKKYTPAVLLMIILSLLVAIFICKWPLP
jgi:hypothetical protein